MQKLQARDNRGPGIRVQLLEGNIFKFFLPIADPDALRQGNIDIHGFPGDPATLFRGLDEMQRAHIVQAVRQFDDQDTDVLGHGQYQFAEIFCLFGTIRLQFQLRQLGHAIDQGGHFFAKGGADVFDGDIGIFNGVVQQTGDDGGAIQPLVT